MKCPECQASNDTSKVYVTGSFSTLMGYEPYWDEEGKYHSHNPNKTTDRFRCSRGHEWSETRVFKWPAGDYG